MYKQITESTENLESGCSILTEYKESYNKTCNIVAMIVNRSIIWFVCAASFSAS